MRAVIMFLSFFLLIYFGYSYGKSNISVVDAALATGIENKNPVGVSDKFPNTVKRVYLWTKIKVQNPPTYIYHVWYYKNREMARIKLYIRYSLFRTWSFKTILPQWTGDWRVQVEDTKGNIIFSKDFTVYKSH